MKNIIIPFSNVGELYFGMSRDYINNNILNTIDYKSEEDIILGTNEKFTDDFFENGMTLGYLNKDFKLSYILLTDEANCNAIFNGKDLLEMNYLECKNYLLQFDPEIKEEEYVGFTSYKLGISIYAPNGTEEPDTFIECVTVAKKGYLEQQDLLAEMI